MARVRPDETLKRQLAAGAQRLRLNDALGAASWAALGTLVGMALLTVAHRVFFLGLPVQDRVLTLLRMPGWALWTMLGLLAVPLVAGAVAYALSGKGLLSAAVTADERLGLRTRLSSAVAMDAYAARSPMAPHLMADARRHAERLKVGRDFPLRAPRPAGYLPWGLGALVLALAFLPQADVLGHQQRAREEADEKEDIKLVAEEIEKRLQQTLKRKPSEKARSKNLPSEKLQEDVSKLVKELKEVADREKAIAKLNKVLDKAEETRQRLAGMTRMMRQMERLKKLGEEAELPKGLASKMAAAMVKGDFKKAAREMEKLRKELAGGGLSDEQKLELKRELEKLTKLTDDWKELAGQLQKAADQMGEEEALEAMQAALEDMKELAELLKELGLEGQEGAGGLGGQCQQVELTKEMIEQLKKMLKNAKRCVVCKKMYCLNCGRPRCACEGLEQCDCEPGQCQGMIGMPGMGGQGPGGGGGAGKGNGTGGAGQGRGGRPPEQEHDVGFQTTQVKGQMGKGRIISRMLVRGLPTVTEGEKQNEYKEAQAAAEKAADQEVNSGRIPRELRKYVRDYFTSTRPGEKK